jgi:hypothetical protein
MNKIKFLRYFLGLIAIISMYAIIYIVNRYNEINDFTIQITENYADLKKLNNEILDLYEVDLKENEKLNELNRRVLYNEHMASALGPNTESAKNYQWIFIGLIWLLILIKWIYDKIKPSQNETLTE